MSKFHIIKISLTVAIIAVVAAGAFFVYQKFADEHSAARTDLMRIIPENCDAFIAIDNLKDLDSIKQNYLIQAYLKNKSNPSIIKTLTNLQPYFSKGNWSGTENSLHQMIISFHTWENEHGELLLFKMAAGDKERIADMLDQHFKSSFAPMIEKNAGIEITHYYVTTGVSFHCFYYKGIFAGSFQNRLIDEAIMRISTPKGKLEEPDFIDIAKDSEKSSSLKFFLRLNGIPLHYGNTPDKVDTLNLTEWIAPELSFSKDKVTMSCYTSPLYEKQNRLCLFIGQNGGQALNPDIISKNCPVCLHYGLSDRDRFVQNQERFYGSQEKDTTFFRKDFMSVDSIFGNHFEGEINIAYYPVLVPEKIYQKVLLIKLDNLKDVAERLESLHAKIDKANEKMVKLPLNQKGFPEKLYTGMFGQIFSLGDPIIYCDTIQNYLVLSGRSETVDSYVKDIKKGDNLTKVSWYRQIAPDIDKESNICFFGKGDSFIEDRYILPFGLPNFLTENPYLFRKNTFCFQFNAEESFIYSNAVIKALKQ
ncbi:hypothetical protein [Parabacteroides sp. FAFU027]|uniref:hypothetical protein n=1 Tax=Parabacteroides sp. FAFU027 TaxID=2922715 RepID=UPI001FAEF603|nr:hypothetical protein [Parabacteroides sp. FAFU027]